MNFCTRANVIGAALAVAGLVAWASSAHADLKCRQTINKESAKLTQNLAKIYQKCEQKVLDGKQPGPCPDPDSAAKITGAEQKLVGKIADKCATSTGEFPFGRCPNETGASGTCGSILVTSKTAVGDCLVCLAEHHAKELVQHVLYAGPLPSPNPSPAPGTGDRDKCKKTVGKETIKFYAAASKLLSKCHDAVLKGKLPPGTICPDSESAAAIATAESKKQVAIAKKCCGDDEVCGGATCSGTPNVICSGGANAGGPCTVNSECPGGACVDNANGDACETNVDCGRCRNGTTNGGPCQSSGQCQSDNNACDPITRKCTGGVNPGDDCASHCSGGPNAGADCGVASECPSGICGDTCGGGGNNGASCSTASECPGGTCGASSALHCYGGANNGASCTTAGVGTECPDACVGGGNDGAACVDDSECPGGQCTCSIPGLGHFCGTPHARCVAECPGIGGGTCVGNSGSCDTTDDLRPVQDLGIPAPCPPLTAAGSPLGVVGQTGASLIDCVDKQANQRVACQEAAGAAFATNLTLPAGCTDSATECSPTGTVDVQVSVTVGAPTPQKVCAGGVNAAKACTVDGDCPSSTCDPILNGISVSLGYNGASVMIPGSGDISGAGKVSFAQVPDQSASNDTNDTVIVSAARNSPPINTGFNPGALFTVHFSKCVATPVAGDFGCVVRSASDPLGHELLDGVSCSVTIM